MEPGSKKLPRYISGSSPRVTRFPRGIPHKSANSTSIKRVWGCCCRQAASCTEGSVTAIRDYLVKIRGRRASYRPSGAAERIAIAGHRRQGAGRGRPVHNPLIELGFAPIIHLRTGGTATVVLK